MKPITPSMVFKMKVMLLSILLSPWGLFGQQDTILNEENSSNKILFNFVLDEVIYNGSSTAPRFKTYEERKRYYYLKRKVYRVYKYAKLATDSLNYYKQQVKNETKKRKKKKLSRKMYRSISEKYKKTLMKLSRNDGRILSRLIHRQTGETTYDIILNYKSGWSAFWWNTKASLFKIDLKQPYDPENNSDDKMIEEILQNAFETGGLKE